MKRWLAVGWAVVAAGFGVAVGLAGCSSDDEQDGGSSGGSGAECEGTQPATLVPVTGGYSIDATEVTRCQYEAWLATGPSTSGQVSACTWNSTYEPICEWPPGTKGDHPVVCVDWCDAYAYCQGVGKRLCGKISGGMNGYDDYANASTSQWYAACSSGGVNDYPYGDTYSGSTCNGDDAGHGTTVPVASKSGCQSSMSGYAGVHDLSGNVWEWEDSCNGNSGNSDLCRLRGGSFYSDYDGTLRCGNGGASDRGDQGGSVGFRCCSSP